MSDSPNAGAGEPAPGRAHRRRRRRATAAQGPPPEPTNAASPPPAPPAAAAEVKADTPPTSTAPRRRREGAPDRGLRDLVGAGHSQLGVSGALRGRDVNRPTEADLAAAEDEVVVVRRNWQPRADG